MPYQLTIGPEAETDIHTAFHWYEGKQHGLGLQFLAQLEITLTSVVESPDSRATYFENARLALVRRFPYVVCYLIEGRSIYVAAVFHGHRDPDSWKRRLQ